MNVAPIGGLGIPALAAGGALVGVAEDNAGHSALVSFALSSGERQWLVPLPDEVHDSTVGVSAQRGQVMLVDESNPASSTSTAAAAIRRSPRSPPPAATSQLPAGGRAAQPIPGQYSLVLPDWGFRWPSGIAARAR